MQLLSGNSRREANAMMQEQELRPLKAALQLKASH